MGLTYVPVVLRVPGTRTGGYAATFLVDTGAMDSMAPASELEAAGIHPAGRATYELADGSVQELTFGAAQIEFMGELTFGRVVFGPDGSEPLLGVTALESIGVTVDPSSKTLEKLPAIYLK
ncbi:MAG: clan AA aspartic protease [Acidimicrobiia bacterium]|nr:clan AA aspartic protease [Acidimicrobiia bacterium]